jgi:hypothetical protein
MADNIGVRDGSVIWQVVHAHPAVKHGLVPRDDPDVGAHAALNDSDIALLAQVEAPCSRMRKMARATPATALPNFAFS